ncbi:hypothetical protein EV561_1802 [Rhizobium sp. BK376]|nr:hypothetical protein EV561_1802 [Rhizobium sp. BK376]
MQCLNPQCSVTLGSRSVVFRKRNAFFCSACHPDEGDDWREPLPCQICGRLVRTYRRYVAPVVYVCGRKCKVRHNTIHRSESRSRSLIVSHCKLCGDAFTSLRKTACYCSKTCKQKAYLRRCGIPSIEDCLRDRRCLFCLKIFSPLGKNAIYCSDTCRQQAYRRRRALKPFDNFDHCNRDV